MADQPAHRHVEVSDGKRVVASAEVTTSPEDPGTAQASLQADSKLDAETVGGTNLIPHSTF